MFSETKKRKRRLALLDTENVGTTSGPTPETSSPSHAETQRGIVESLVPADDSNNVEPHAKRYRKHLLDLWASNKQSAKTIQEFASLSQKAGAKGVTDVESVGNHGLLPNNFARDLMRRALLGCVMPLLYWAMIPCWDAEQGKCEDTWMPFLMPHELINALLKSGAINLALLLATTAGTAMDRIKHKVCKELGVEAESHLMLGLHGDGVAMQKSGQTTEVFTFYFPTLPHAERLLWGCLEKRFFCKCGCSGRHTLDPILNLFVWFMRICHLGRHPESRHDSRPWLASDSVRSKMTGLFAWTASLVQVRGDWAWYKAVMSFGGWAAKEICWLCQASQEDGEAPFQEVDGHARWRRLRYKPGEFLRKMRQAGIILSPLLSCPGMKLDYLTIDVLHALDLGFACDALGSFFWSLVSVRSSFLDGTIIAERVTSLWKRINALYKANATECRMQTLTKDMLIKKKKGAKPKLRTKGGETRHLAPIALHIATDMLAVDDSPYWSTIRQMLSRLFDFYMALTVVPFVPKACSTACRECLILCKALGTQCDGLWPMKPKVHMWQELAEYVAFTLGNPAFWCYKDEDFVGVVAAIASSRGGGRSDRTTAETALNKYRALSNA